MVMAAGMTWEQAVLTLTGPSGPFAITDAIVGGDGTVSSVLTALHRAYGDKPLPKIALLRGGSMNTIANSFGLPRRSPKELLEMLLEGGAHPVWPRATLAIEGRLGFLFTAAVLVGFLDVLYERRSKGRGPLAALSLLSAASLQALLAPIVRLPTSVLGRVETPLQAVLEIDGDVHPERRYTALAAGTVEQVGLGFRPFRLARECQDKLQLFAFHGSVQALVRELPKIHAGKPITQGLGFDPACRKLVIEANEPIRYALDGDLHQGGARLELTVGPKVEIVAL
jgi:diacylglycerol kinase family enzyme